MSSGLRDIVPAEPSAEVDEETELLNHGASVVIVVPSERCSDAFATTPSTQSIGRSIEPALGLSRDWVRRLTFEAAHSYQSPNIF